MIDFFYQYRNSRAFVVGNLAQADQNSFARDTLVLCELMKIERLMTVVFLMCPT